MLDRYISHLQHLVVRAQYALAGDDEAAGDSPAPVVVVSLPRSGSSWVGSILGRAPDAYYFREPMTQTQKRLAAEDRGTVFDIDEADPPRGYRTAARAAFAGVPRFRHGIVPYAGQWLRNGHGTHRVVVKEVNPLMCPWLVHAYHARIILLLRHPAAVALSYHRLGWHLDYAPLGIDASEPFWTRHGAFQARALSRTWAFLRPRNDYRVVHYEDICRDPVGGFRSLFDFAGVTWDNAIEARIRAQSSRADDRSDYATTKVSRHAADAWRGRIGGDDLAALREGYRRCALPWYQDDSDWLVN